MDESNIIEIELLYFTDCPSWQSALDNLHQAFEGANLPYQVHLVEITDAQQAQAEHFLGSPSFRMNGIDLWPEKRNRYNMSCRVYRTPDGYHGSPTVDMLLDKIRGK